MSLSSQPGQPQLRILDKRRLMTSLELQFSQNCGASTHRPEVSLGILYVLAGAAAGRGVSLDPL